MSFLGFGKKKEEVKVSEPLPPPTQQAPVEASKGISSPIDAAALLPKQEDFSFEHITQSPLEANALDTPPPIEKVELVPVMPTPEQLLEDAPAPEEHSEMDLSELSKQLPIQDVPRPPENETLMDSSDLSLDIPDDLMMPEAEPEEQIVEEKKEV